MISLKDPKAWAGLWIIAVQYQDSGDREFGDDLLERINSLIADYDQKQRGYEKSLNDLAREGLGQPPRPGVGGTDASE